MKIVDMHCDTISEIAGHRRQNEACALRENTLHVDLKRMRESGYLLQNFALFINIGECAGTPWEELCSLYEVYLGELAQNADILAPVYRYEDIEKNRREGKLSAMLTVEEGAVCQGDIEKLERLYDMGVRMMTLTWNHPNELGSPNLDSGVGKEVWREYRRLREEKCTQGERDRIQNNLTKYLCTPDTVCGLTRKGREFVCRMEELGMIPDVSHLADRGFYDVLQSTRKPFVASHSNAREICGCVRNLTDEMIRSLARRGGCMGLNFCADFLELPSGGKENPGTIEAVVRHARHIVRVGGEEVLGLGSDFDGIDTNRELPGAQSMEKLWHALHGAGFTQRQLDLIFGENVLRIYKEVLA